jgi:hypothetical protein
MGCLFYPRKQTSVSYAADRDGIACYGRAKPTDKHLASKIHCVDDGMPTIAEKSATHTRLNSQTFALNGQSGLTNLPMTDASSAISIGIIYDFMPLAKTIDH